MGGAAKFRPLLIDTQCHYRPGHHPDVVSRSFGHQAKNAACVDGECSMSIGRSIRGGVWEEKRNLGSRGSRTIPKTEKGCGTRGHRPVRKEPADAVHAYSPLQKRSTSTRSLPRLCRAALKPNLTVVERWGGFEPVANLRFLGRKA